MPKNKPLTLQDLPPLYMDENGDFSPAARRGSRLLSKLPGDTQIITAKLYYFTGPNAHAVARGFRSGIAAANEFFSTDASYIQDTRKKVKVPIVLIWHRDSDMTELSQLSLEEIQT